MHPDRLVDADATQRAGAALKMAELNAAWEVLRDPERRRAHDRRRGGRPAPSVSGVEGAPGGRAVAHPPAGAPLLEPEPEGAPTLVRRRRGLRGRPLEVAALVVVVLVVIVAIALAGGEAPSEDVETTGRFPIGSCVVVTPTPGVVEAPCDGPDAVRVVATEAFPRPCPSGTVAVVLLEEQRSLCVEGAEPPG